MHTPRAGRVVRPARVDDLAGVQKIAQSFGLLGGWPSRPNFLDREYETGRLAVATVDEQVAAYAGAGTAQGCADVVLAAIASAAGSGQVRIAVPGPHPLLPVLIAAGMRIVDTDTYLASHTNLIDLDRYIPNADLG